MRVGIWNQRPVRGLSGQAGTAGQVVPRRGGEGQEGAGRGGQADRRPEASIGEWIADIERPAEQYRGRYQTKLEEAKSLLKSRPAAQPVVAAAAAVVWPWRAPGGGGAIGSAALASRAEPARRARGRHERGPQVDEYLAAAGVSPGNPWCASFITWSLEKAGHKMPGGGWAAVQTWVRNAEQGNNGLKIVSAEDARPGDIVAYDWGGQTDFGADGHIGFLDERPSRTASSPRWRATTPTRSAPSRAARAARTSSSSASRATRPAGVAPVAPGRPGARRAGRSGRPVSSSAARAPAPAARRAPRRSRCSRTRTSCSTRSGSRTSRRAGSTRA